MDVFQAVLDRDVIYAFQILRVEVRRGIKPVMSLSSRPFLSGSEETPLLQTDAQTKASIPQELMEQEACFAISHITGRRELKLRKDR